MCIRVADGEVLAFVGAKYSWKRIVPRSILYKKRKVNAALIQFFL